MNFHRGKLAQKNNTHSQYPSISRVLTISTQCSWSRFRCSVGYSNFPAPLALLPELSLIQRTRHATNPGGLNFCCGTASFLMIGRDEIPDIFAKFSDDKAGCDEGKRRREAGRDACLVQSCTKLFIIVAHAMARQWLYLSFLFFFLTLLSWILEPLIPWAFGPLNCWMGGVNLNHPLYHADSFSFLYLYVFGLMKIHIYFVCNTVRSSICVRM